MYRYPFYTRFLSTCFLLLLLIGCAENPCEGRNNGCGALTKAQEVELFELGVTLSSVGTRFLEHKIDEGVAVLEGMYFFFPPVPGTESVELQRDRYNVDTAISKSSRLSFLDRDGVVLDGSNNPNCWRTALGEVGGNTVVATATITLPDSLNFLLRTWTKCIPVTAKTIVHQVVDDDGGIQTIVKVDLDKLRSWRNIVKPLLCRNGHC